jgi:hypothetical protein
MEKGDITATCAICGSDCISDGFGTGYGVVPDPPGEYYAGYDLQANDKVCYACCAKTDLAHMASHNKTVLYLSKDKELGWVVQNWPGSLKYRATVSVSKNGHYSPLSGYMERRDAWFRDTNGHYWWGRSIGGRTEICHCKKIKSRQAIASARWWLGDRAYLEGEVPEGKACNVRARQ